MKSVPLSYNPRYLKHSWKVAQRVRARLNRESDVDNGAYQILPDTFRGTHPQYDYARKSRLKYLKALQGKDVDAIDVLSIVMIAITAVLFITHLAILAFKPY